MAGRKLGTLGVAARSETHISEEDVELLCQVANQLAIAVENALNYERARKAEQAVKRQLDRERLMLEINNAVVSILDLSELVKAVSASLRDISHELHFGRHADGRMGEGTGTLLASGDGHTVTAAPPG